MPAANLIAYAASKVSKAIELARTVHEAVVDIEIRKATSDLTNLIIDLQTKLLEIQSATFETTQELMDAKSQLKAAADWEETVAKYEKMRVPGSQDLILFKLKQQFAEGPEPFVCPHCFTNDRKVSFLQQVKAGISDLTCHACKFTAITTEPYIPSPTAFPRRSQLNRTINP